MIADVVVVMAVVPKTDSAKGGITAFICPMDTPGITVAHRNEFMGLRGIENSVTEFRDVFIPRANVIAGFSNPAISAFYILAIGLLCLHLYHGLWSMFQSLGLSHPRYTPKLKQGAAVFAILIAIGNCSIPIAVMVGLVK